VTKICFEVAKATAACGALFLGISAGALADHQPSVDIEISTPRVYTRFATGAPYAHYPNYGPGAYYAYAPVAVPVYVPGYWTWNPPRVYWEDGRRHYDEPRYRGHGKHHRKHHHHD
jgi:hypothetical protein